MFGKKKQPPIKSLIALGTCIEGNLKFSDGLRIDGEVKGDIRAGEGCASILVISETAVVTGSIFADHVIVNGRIMGQVHAAELLELQPKARIVGDVSYKALEMYQGSIISGQLRPLGEVSEASSATAGEKIVFQEEKPSLKLAANNF